MSSNIYKKCNLCARNCGINRENTVGYCKMKNEMYVARAALHFWEEPPISGDRGSGTIFFSGCSLSCSFCQNRDISRGRMGKLVGIKELSEIMTELQNQGAQNINLVTPTHFIPSVNESIELARKKGVHIPMVYNTASYENVDGLKILDGKIDVYLADMKYFLGRTAGKHSNAKDYPEVAKAAIAEMFRQVGEAKFDDNIMVKGVIVRILLLPGHVAEAKLILKYLFDTYGDKIYISLMNQYTPMPGMEPPLNRCVTHDEYRQLIDYAEKIGLQNGFTQDFGTAKESFIPSFGIDEIIK